MTLDTPAVQNGNGAMAPRSAYANKNAEIWKFAEALSRSELIPKHFQSKPANVFLALQIADRGDLDAFAVMSNLFVVHGTPAFSSKFLIALANMRGPFRGPLRFRTTAKPLAVTCYGTLRETGEEVSSEVTMAQAEAAGWTKNVKYKEIPVQMLSYRAATFLIRLTCPEVAVMGARTVDEVEDIYASGDRTEPEYRDAAPVRRDPLSLELEAKPTTEPQATREEGKQGESGGAAVGSGGPLSPSPHAAAIAAFVVLGVPSNVIEAEIAYYAEVTGEDVTAWLRSLHKAAKKDGPRALITMLRSEKACDLLDLALASAPAAVSATDELFPGGGADDAV